MLLIRKKLAKRLIKNNLCIQIGTQKQLPNLDISIESQLNDHA